MLGAFSLFIDYTLNHIVIFKIMYSFHISRIYFSFIMDEFVLLKYFIKYIFHTFISLIISYHAFLLIYIVMLVFSKINSNIFMTESFFYELLGKLIFKFYYNAHLHLISMHFQIGINA